jgi:glyoxylase-like metal-dependent hydrolase (beta-lactamase superfamily II)
MEDTPMKEAPSNPSRRFFVKTVVAVSAAAALPMTSRHAFAQRASVTAAQMRAGGATAKIDTRPLRNGVSVLMGSGGNILVLPGADGKLAVDTGFATSQRQIASALSALSAEPLRHVINTHWHFDHTDGNQWMHGDGGTIIAHERTRLRMSSRIAIPAFDVVLLPSPAAALPTVLFAHSHPVTLNGELIQLRRYTPAHTDTDISVFFSKANVLHTGDTWFNGFYPFVDYDSGGSIQGLLTASTENLSLADRHTIVVPGHGNAGTRQDLVDFHEMLLAVCDKVAALKGSGASLDAAIAARPTMPFDKKWGGGFVSPDLFTGLVYRGV